MSFLQAAPGLENQYRADVALGSYLDRVLPPPVRAATEAELVDMGRLSVELYREQLEDRLNEPRLTHWDGWGRRVDRIELTPLWRKAERIAAERGVVAAAYERFHGRFSRVHQFALAYLFTPSTDIYACPLAMSDGAARVLIDSGNRELIDRAVPRLTSRDPGEVWTSGQWMTETVGGSDVGGTETVARQAADGTWRLHGRKWFTSAATSQMALTLARPEGNPGGGKGLALFYLETRDEQGHLRGITIDRLKDKLGTRKLPTAELTLDGVPAVPVRGLGDGVRSIAPMLNITRAWNAMSACALMRRGIALARDYASRRKAFGRPLADHPLHADTLEGVEANLEGALHLTFRVAELIGRVEAGEDDGSAASLLRILTPLAKLFTARQAVAAASECLEAFGGAGYVEDTGLPVLLRDAQVLTIWEGTTNVLALDTLRAIEGIGPEPLLLEIERCAVGVRDPGAATALARARDATRGALEWLSATATAPAQMEAGARRFAMTLAGALQIALLASHAQWEANQNRHGTALRSALRLAADGIDRLHYPVGGGAIG